MARTTIGGYEVAEAKLTERNDKQDLLAGEILTYISSIEQGLNELSLKDFEAFSRTLHSTWRGGDDQPDLCGAEILKKCMDIRQILTGSRR